MCQYFSFINNLQISTMKKVLSLMLCLAVAAGLSNFAQASVVTRDLGYVTTDEYVYDYTGFSNGSASVLNVSCAIKIPAETIQDVCGASFTSVKIAWDSRNIMKGAKVWLRKSYGDEDLASGTADLKFGWNTVRFDSPYVIDENCGDLLFGVDVVAQPGEFYFATSTYGGNSKADACFLINRDEYAEIGDQAIIDVDWLRQENPYNNYMILAAGTVEFDTEAFPDRVALTKMEYNPMVVDTDPGSAILWVQNNGSNDVSVMTISYKLGENTRDYDLTLSQPIRAGRSSSFAVPMIALGTGEHTISISKVNDNANNNTPTYQTAELLCIPAAAAASYERRCILEWFASETIYHTPKYFESCLWPSYEPFQDRMSLVIHHISDQFMIGENEDLQLALALTDKDQAQCPAMALDRSRQIFSPIIEAGNITYSTVTPEGAALVFPEAFDIPTFAGLDAESSYDPESGIATITINGSIAENVLPDDENLLLTVYVTEDNVYSDSQEFPSESGDPNEPNPGEFYHMAVIRQQPTPMAGEEVTEHSGNFTRTYKVEIDPTWKAADMKIIAMVNRRMTNSLANRNVVNVTETEMDPEGASIESVAAVGHTSVIVKNGCATVNGSTEGVEVYTSSGTRVNNSQLRPGVYVVRVENNVAKIFVK